MEKYKTKIEKYEKIISVKDNHLAVVQIMSPDVNRKKSACAISRL